MMINLINVQLIPVSYVLNNLHGYSSTFMSIYSLHVWMMLHKAESVLMITSESSVRV